MGHRDTTTHGAISGIIDIAHRRKFDKGYWRNKRYERFRAVGIRTDRESDMKRVSIHK